nr:protein FAR1-related sequence 5-like [Tanacetum cinerariifolium]
MPLLAPMLVVPAGGDAAGAAANVAAGLGPSSAPQVPPVREHTPMREPSPVREPTPVREPSPRPDQEPTPDSPNPLSPPPSSAAVGSTTSSRPPTAMAAGGAEDSAALTALSLKLDRCLHRVTTLENELGITKKVLGGAVLKLVTRVKRLEGLLQQRKRRLVLLDSEGEDATTTEREFDLAALHILASATLGDDSSALAAGPDAETTMPVPGTSTTRRRLRKPFTSSASAHVSETIPAGVRVPAATTTIHAGSSVEAAAPSSSIPTTADKGKAPMVDDSLPADLQSKQERVLKNLHDSQLGEELAKKIHAKQEVEFGRQQEELAQKAQAGSVASPTEHELLAKIATNSALSKQLLGDDVTEDNMNEPLGMLLLRKRRELKEQSRVKPMTKTQQRDYMRDIVKNNSASVYNQGWTMKKVKTLSIDPLRLEFEYIQKHLERSNLLNFRRSTFHPKPTLDVPPAKRANQGAPQVPAVSLQDPVGIPAAPSIPADVSLPAATSSAPADIPVPVVSIAHAAVSVHVEPMVTPIVDVADAAMIKFDSDSDDDPLPYGPYAGWEMVHSPLGSVHAYHNMAGHTKHFTTLREILHMVERTDLQQLLGAFLDDEDALYFWRNQDSWRIRSWQLYPRAQVHVLEMVDGQVIHMFVDVSYPLSVGTLERMLKHGLEVSKLLVGGFSCWFSTTLQMLFSSPWLTTKKELTHHEELLGGYENVDATKIDFKNLSHDKNFTFEFKTNTEEEVVSYECLIQAFLNTDVKEPYVLLIDQDPSMLIAIPNKFTTAKHRLCMWQIMNKLPTKIESSICEESGFKKRLCSLAWGESDEPHEFEIRAGGQYLFKIFLLRPSQVVIEPIGLFLSQRIAAPVKDIGNALSITTYSLVPRSPYGSAKLIIKGQRQGLESVSIRRIQGIGYDVLRFLGVETTFDIFQNIHFLYLQYDIVVFWIRRIEHVSFVAFVAMTMVIKGEFETLETLKINDVLLTCDTSLEIFHDEFNRLSNMDDDLFTYKVKIAWIANVPCDLNRDDESKQQMSQESDNDMEGDVEVELTDEESFDSDDEGEFAGIFRIKTNVFDFEAPLYRTFKEFNFLLQIDPDVLTKDIKGFKTYEEYKDDWIYK